jgi:hypothetical protein
VYKYRGMIIMTSQDDQSTDKDDFTLHPSDGSFTIKPRKISLKKSRSKKKKDVQTELDNVRLDMIE